MNKLIRRNPYSLMDEIFNQNLQETKNPFHKESHCGTMPRANILETEKSYIIELAAPGMEKENFKINLEKNVLNIEGENGLDDAQYTHQEFCYENFNRRFVLPKEADMNKIKADYKDGILIISIEKREEALIKNKEIKIS